MIYKTEHLKDVLTLNWYLYNQRCLVEVFNNLFLTFDLWYCVSQKCGRVRDCCGMFEEFIILTSVGSRECSEARWFRRAEDRCDWRISWWFSSVPPDWTVSRLLQGLCGEKPGDKSGVHDRQHRHSRLVTWHSDRNTSHFILIKWISQILFLVEMWLFVFRCMVEAGFDYNTDVQLNPAVLEQMLNKSPIKHVIKVSTCRLHDVIIYQFKTGSFFLHYERLHLNAACVIYIPFVRLRRQCFWCWARMTGVCPINRALNTTSAWRLYKYQWGKHIHCLTL